MVSERVSGVLLHVTSLPSYGGVGDFGPAAYAFVDFLAAANNASGRCCRSTPPATAARPTPHSLRSPATRCSSRWSVWSMPAGSRPIASRGCPATRPLRLRRAFDCKRPLIEEAAANFLDRATDEERARFQRFCQDNISWLTD